MESQEQSRISCESGGSEEQPRADCRPGRDPFRFGREPLHQDLPDGALQRGGPFATSPLRAARDTPCPISTLIQTLGRTKPGSRETRPGCAPPHRGADQSVAGSSVIVGAGNSRAINTLALPRPASGEGALPRPWPQQSTSTRDRSAPGTPGRGREGLRRAARGRSCAALRRSGRERERQEERKSCESECLEETQAEAFGLRQRA